MSAISLLRVRSRRLWLTTLGIVAMVLATVAPATAALPVTQTPVLTLNHLITTQPFAGSSTSMNDNEDSVYVPQDNSLWLVDDDARKVYEINPSTGALKNVYDRTVFEALPQAGGGPAAGAYRDRDFESLAYDASTDTLYAFSGSCCNVGNLPAAFRFTRQNGQLTPTDYQPLPTGSDFTAASWNPTEGKIYVGVRHDIQTYDYATNTTGPVFQVAGLGAIEGFAFTADGNDLFVARSQMGGTNPYQKLTRVDWASKKIVSGWDFDLSPFGVMDARGVTLLNDQFYVNDGYDNRPGDPKDHAVFVFDVSADSGPVVAPTATFTAAAAPSSLSVKFTDTSAGKPNAWKWQFGDKKTSAMQSPTHVYAAPGDYKVTLTVTNSAGSSVTSQTITVPLAAKFTATPSTGAAPLDVAFADASSGKPTGWQWDFGDGGSSTAPNPKHTFTAAGDYTVKLTVSSPLGSDSTSQVISVGQSAPAGTASFTASQRSGAAPLRVHFTDTSTGAPTAWAWDFGDGSTSSAQNPTHRFARPGAYTVRLTVTTARGVSSSSMAIRARDLRAPNGRYSATPLVAHVRHTRVAVVQRSLSDDFTPRRAIRRVVRWGDGTKTTWRSGTKVRHVYRKRGTFHPQVILTDRAGNHRTVRVHRIVVRR